MIFFLVTAHILALVFLRWILEPACPDCAAKRWNENSGTLQCRTCGWNNAGDSIPSGAVADAS